MALAAESLGLRCMGFEKAAFTAGTAGGIGSAYGAAYGAAFWGSGASGGGVGVGGDFARAELGLSSGGSPALAFLRPGLLAVARESGHFRNALLASVGDCVKVCGRVGIENDSGVGKAAPKSNSNFQGRFHVTSTGGDIRLSSWLTNALLTSVLTTSHRDPVLTSLFNSWAKGLLSPSMPFRMLSCAHCAGILNAWGARAPALLNDVVKPGLVARYLRRLGRIVERRIWAERAQAPVYSKYLQLMVELLVAVEHNGGAETETETKMETETEIGE